MTSKLLLRCVSSDAYFRMGDDGLLREGRYPDETLICVRIGALYHGFVEGDYFRVVDESGEDYLYPRDRFEIVGPAIANTVVWAPIVVDRREARLTIRVAAPADVPMLDLWDREPSVIACASDNPEAEQAFQDAYWPDEIAGNSDVTCYYIAELDGRPIGAMQVIDPHREPTHYWGEIEPGLRAIDIWIGAPEDRNKGHGAAMMRAVIGRCFEDADVHAIVIDPLASNADAHRFYQRLGFKPLGRRRFGGDDCLVHRLERNTWRGS